MSTYTYNTFLNQYTDTDSNLQIIDTDGVIKFTINPYSILTTMISNNLLTFKIKSGRLISIPFSTMNESKIALILAEERIQLLVNKTPNFIDKQVEKYVEVNGGTSLSEKKVLYYKGVFTQTLDGDPITQVFTNETIFDINFIRSGVGVYSATIPSNGIELVYINVSNNSISGDTVVYSYVLLNSKVALYNFLIYTKIGLPDTLEYSDDVLTNTFVEIGIKLI